MTLKLVTITDWPQFGQVANSLRAPSPLLDSYMFRGHADISWPLQPTLARIATKAGLSEEDTLGVERLSLEKFREQAHLYLSPNAFSVTTDSVSWLTLMRHHGVPTRLLDWTSSPYIALYFAVTEGEGKDGAIWCAHIHTVNSRTPAFPETEPAIQSTFFTPNQPALLHLVRRKSSTERMTAQQGGFSVCQNVLADHGDLINKLCGDEPQILFLRLTIPANLKREFAARLREFNIAAHSLFPGLDGLGRSVKELVMLAGN